MATFGIRSASVSFVSSGEVYFPAEQHRLAGALTSYPVESGKNLNDNYVKRSDELMLEGIVSDVEPGVTRGNAAAVWARVAAQLGGQLIVVYTHIKTYRNMAVLEATARRDKGIKGGLIFNLKLQEVQFASSQTVFLGSAVALPTGPAAYRTHTIQGGTRVARTVSAPRFGLDILESPGTNVGV